VTVEAEIRERAGEMTAAERKVVAVILADYPFGGLSPIQELADRARVSAPSVTRFVNKLGYAGYQDFQRRLIGELKERARSPIDLHGDQELVPRAGFLSAYCERVGGKLAEAARAMSEADFLAVCEALGDRKRQVFVIGGRVSDALAHFLSMSLRFLRADVHHVPGDPEMWPEYLQKMRPRDIVVVFDYRRYQRSLELFAERAAAIARPQIVLFTDQWLSPVASHATRIFALPIAVGTLWDTFAAPLVLIEAMVVKVSTDNWDAVRPRLEAWDRLRLDPPTADPARMSDETRGDE